MTIVAYPPARAVPEGFTETAWRQVTTAADTLRTVGEADFAFDDPAYRGPDGRAHDRRWQLRALAALPGLREVSDRTRLTELVVEATNSRVFTVERVGAVLDGTPGESTVDQLQQVGRELAAGQPVIEAADRHGVTEGQVAAVQSFLGIVEYEAQAGPAIAKQAVREGWTTAQLRETTGWDAATSQRALAEARDALGLTDEDVEWARWAVREFGSVDVAVEAVRAFAEGCAHRHSGWRGLHGSDFLAAHEVADRLRTLAADLDDIDRARDDVRHAATLPVIRDLDLVTTADTLARLIDHDELDMVSCVSLLTDRPDTAPLARLRDAAVALEQPGAAVGDVATASGLDQAEVGALAAFHEMLRRTIARDLDLGLAANAAGVRSWASGRLERTMTVAASMTPDSHR